MPATTVYESSSPPLRSGACPVRNFSLTNLPLVRQLVDFVCDPDKKNLQDGEEQVDTVIRRSWSVEDIAKVSDGERVGRCPYSLVVKNPVPFEFHMPLHYPKFTKQDYERMPEWQIDRLLEEYGLPASAMGTVEEKRTYAIGAFLWDDK